MSCEMVSSRKIDYYVNDPYVTIIDIREEDKFLHSRIKGAIHYEYNKLMADINNIFKYGKVSYEFRRLFSNKETINAFNDIIKNANTNTTAKEMDLLDDINADDDDDEIV